MSSFEAIEKGRKKNRYVYYEFPRMSRAFPDSWDPTAPWCTYWITGETGVSRKQMFNEATEARSTLTLPGKERWRAISDALYAVRGVDSGMVSAFGRMVTVDHPKEIEYNLKLAIYGGANINDALLISDIRECRNSRQVEKVFKILTAQVYVAAVNGAFAKLFNVGEQALVNPANDFTKVNVQICELLTNYHNVIMYGGHKHHALDFPEGELGFRPAVTLYDLGVEIQNNLHNQTPDAVCKLLEQRIVKILDTFTKRS